MEINLCNIFRYLTENDDLLKVSEHTVSDQSTRDKKKPNIMVNMVVEYVQLRPREKQSTVMFPTRFRPFLLKDHYRVGIRYAIEKNLNTVNVSFINSLNLLLKPEQYDENYEEDIKNTELFESFVAHSMINNCQIDKLKNTKKMQALNHKMVTDMTTGNISNELIQYIVNIFEINLVVFSLVTDKPSNDQSDEIDGITLYWACGTKYPYFNLFKDLHYMTRIGDNYEPVMYIGKNTTSDINNRLYITVLKNIHKIKCNPKFDISILSLPVLESWNIPPEDFQLLILNLFNKPTKKISTVISQYAKYLENKNQ